MLTLGFGLLQEGAESSAPGPDFLPPSNMAAPELVGKAEIGATVSSRPGIWAGRPAPEVRTTLFVGGAARRSPCLLGPEDDGKEIVVTDVASNSAGETTVSSSRFLAAYPAPRALSAPEDISIGAGDGAVVVDAGSLFVGTLGGQWTAASAAGADALHLEIDETGRLTLGPGTLSGSTSIRVGYANSGGSSSGIFTASAVSAAPPAPTYDGSLQPRTAILDSAFELSAGDAFTGENLTFAATGLPPDLDIDAKSGGVSGTLASAGEFAVTITATNPGGEARGTFALTVTEAPLAAPTYDGSLQAAESTVGVTFLLNAGSAFTGDELIFSAQDLAPGLTIDAATGRIVGAPTAEGAYATTITAKNSAGEASGSFEMLVAGSEQSAPAAPTYDGAAPDLDLAPDVAMTPVDLSAHFTGAEIRYFATGLPSRLSIDSITGLISGTPNGVSSGPVTVMARNPGGAAHATFTISVGEESGCGDDPAPTETASVESTGLAIDVASATIGIGDEEAGREVYFSVLAGGVEDAGLTVNGGASGLTLVASDSYTKRSAQVYRATGLTGATADIALAGAADTEHTAAFKVVGYRPASGDPWVTKRQAGGNANTTTLTVTVPANGAVLLHGKRYDLLSHSPSGTVIDESVGDGLRGYWKNAGASASVSFTFATSSSTNEKYAAALILEKTS